MEAERGKSAGADAAGEPWVLGVGVAHGNGSYDCHERLKVSTTGRGAGGYRLSTPRTAAGASRGLPAAETAEVVTALPLGVVAAAWAVAGTSRRPGLAVCGRSIVRQLFGHLLATNWPPFARQVRRCSAVALSY